MGFDKLAYNAEYRLVNRVALREQGRRWWSENRDRKLQEARDARAYVRALTPPPPPYVPPVEKACTYCKVVKPLLDFKPAKTRDGKSSACRVCLNADHSERANVKRATDPAWRDASAAYKRAARRAADPSMVARDALKAARDALKADHREHVETYHDHQSELGRANAHVATYRAHIRNTPRRPTPLLPDAYAARFARAYERCKTSIRRARRKGRRVPGVGMPQLLPYYLRAVQLERITGLDWDVDHLQAYAKGGWHEAGNLQILPRALNALKGASECKMAIGVPTKRELEDAWLL